MGFVIERVVHSPANVLELLSCENYVQYQKEFNDLIKDCTDLMTEDWSTEPELLEVLYCYIRCRKPHTVVEIGTYKGKSSLVFGAALQNNSKNWGTLFTIDNDHSGVLEEAKIRLKEDPASNRIILLEQSSQQAFSEWKRAKIDFLFIDGSHTYLNACCDFSLWSRHLSENGIIVMHDTVTRLERCFPKDYVHPLSYYDILNITEMEDMSSGQEWEGCGFIAKAGFLSQRLNTEKILNESRNTVT